MTETKKEVKIEDVSETDAPEQKSEKPERKAWTPRAYCIQCASLVTIPDGRDFGRCRCPNNTTVSAEGVTARNPRHAMSADEHGILSRAVAGPAPAVTKLTGYINITGGPVMLFNSEDQPIGIIPASDNGVTWNTTVDVCEWERTMSWPVPIVHTSIAGAGEIEIKGATKDSAIIAQEYAAYILHRSGYKNVVTPDTSMYSAVFRGSRLVGFRRLTRFRG